jgi:hypothetical protein
MENIDYFDSNYPMLNLTIFVNKVFQNQTIGYRDSINTLISRISIFTMNIDQVSQNPNSSPLYSFLLNNLMQNYYVIL